MNYHVFSDARSGFEFSKAHSALELVQLFMHRQPMCFHSLLPFEFLSTCWANVPDPVMLLPDVSLHQRQLMKLLLTLWTVISQPSAMHDPNMLPK